MTCNNIAKMQLDHSREEQDCRAADVLLAWFDRAKFMSQTVMKQYDDMMDLQTLCLVVNVGSLGYKHP